MIDTNRPPRVKINNSKWHKDNGLRITVRTLHDGFKGGGMYSVEHARLLAEKLIKACDDVESERNYEPCEEDPNEYLYQLGSIVVVCVLLVIVILKVSFA